MISLSKLGLVKGEQDFATKFWKDVISTPRSKDVITTSSALAGLV